MKKTLLTTLILLTFTLCGVSQADTFAPHGAEWYFNLSSFMGSPISYYHMEVLGDTIIQGHQCSIISPQYLGGNGINQYVYEDNGKVYWYNQTLQDFTTLYDFNAEEGDSWICEVDACTFEVRVSQVSQLTWEGHTYRVQYVYGWGNYDLYYSNQGAIVEGIGELGGLFPYPDACNGSIYDGPYPDYLRCYLVDGEMLYHSDWSPYDCDEYGYCWDGTVAESYAGGDGTANNPYRIATSQQLALLAQQTNDGTGGDAYYVLTEDISLAGCTGVFSEWIPIGMPVLTPGNGSLDTTYRFFTGHFDGQDHSIIGMHQIIENGELEPVGGLFGCTDNAEIKSVRLLQCSVTGNGKYVGGLVGHAGQTDISGCSISYGSSVLTNHWDGIAGGLIGYAGMPFGRHGVSEQTVHLTNCSVQEAVTVHGSWAAGGIVGEVNKDYSLSQTPCEISNCSTLQYYQSFYIQSESAAGGIVGRMINGTITDCTNQYKVIGADTYGVGGIVGDADHVTVSQCTNGDLHYSDYGEVVGEYATGGIVGRASSLWSPFLDVIGCTNYGTVTGHNTTSGTFVGGIVGFGASLITRCANKGNVSLTAWYSGSVGGIVGDCSCYVANCYNRGNVTAAYDEPSDALSWLFAGGIIGTPDAIVYNVYNTGTVTGPEVSAFPDVLYGYGNIIGYGIEDSHYLNAYWLENDMPACGNVSQPELHGSSVFHSGMTSTIWQLDEAQYGTTDLLEALNYGAVTVFDSVLQYPYLTIWWEDYGSGWNNGYPRIGSNVGPGLNSFVVDDLEYSVISFDPAMVCLEGVKEGSEGPATLVIHETVNYYGHEFTVTKIAERAFMSWRRWTHELVIPNTITEIGADAFNYTAFTGPLAIPNSVVNIGDRAFRECLNLTELTLSDHLLTIGEEAFYKCTNMNGTLTLPEDLTTIGLASFAECGFTGSLVIPNTVDSIGAAAFRDCHFDGQLMLPDSLQKLGYKTFMNCLFTGRLHLPNTMTEIGSQAFDGCQFGDTLVVPESLESIWFGVFMNCNQLEALKLPSTLRGIDHFGFAYCINLRSITIDAYLPPSTQDWAFDSIPNDIPVYIPNGSLCAYQNDNKWSYFTNFIEGDGRLPRSEWYYEILNENGSITYQHLEYVADTTVNHKDVKIIIRTNTLYDKSGHTDVTQEYIYEEDCRVYWWNPTLQEFTMLYDYDAREGSEWEIKVGTESITVHVDAVELYDYDGRQYKTLHVSDEGDFFSGTIVCNVGHLTSFFPERLMTRSKAYRVEGMRCYWIEDELVFKYGDKDCDEVYQEYHYGIEEDGPSTGTGTLSIYPNPTDNILVVEKQCLAFHPTQTYRITNLMGQTLMVGQITAENQQIDVSELPQGMYFISIGDMTRKFVVR